MVVFVVVRCCSCEIFQVHHDQSKRSKKWTCKVCNVKQSLGKVFGEGTAADCRKHVQKLNLMQGEKDQQVVSAVLAMPADIYDTSFDGRESPDTLGSSSHRPVFVSGAKSKWSAFVEPHDIEEDNEEGVWLSEWTTNKEEFEKGKKKIRRERRVANEGVRARMSGFHPVSLPPVTNTLSPAHSLPSSDRPTPVFPYTALGEGIADHLHKPPSTPLTTSRSSHCLDMQVHGTYRQIDNQSRQERERPLLSSHSAHNLIGLGKVAQTCNRSDINGSKFHNSSVSESSSQIGKLDEVKRSKWSQFLTEFNDEKDEDEISELF